MLPETLRGSIIAIPSIIPYHILICYNISAGDNLGYLHESHNNEIACYSKFCFRIFATKHTFKFYSILRYFH